VSGLANGGQGAAADIPAGVNATDLLKKRGEAMAANEEDAVKSAKAAAELKPYLDAAAIAYRKAINAGAIGPIAGSEWPRKAAALGHTAAESARQDYDTALKNLQARITAAQNKGEGQVSNFERQMYAAQFPTLTATDPEDQFKYLQHLRNVTAQTIGQGGVPGLGQTPTVAPIMQRPEIPNTQPPATTNGVRWRIVQ
jgi:hypothetical protein